MDDSILDYYVVFGDDLQQFNEEMTRTVRDGWQPLGSLIVSHVGEKVFFYQAVAKTESSPV